MKKKNMMDLDPHMETDLILPKKPTEIPAAKSELLQAKKRLVTMISDDYQNKKAGHL